jgi:hypothetical protein
MRNPDDHVPFITSHVVDAIGNRFTKGVAGEVIDQDRVRGATPLVAWILKEPDQFLFLGIHANHRPAAPQKRLAPSHDILKLLIAPERLLARAKRLWFTRSEYALNFNNRLMVGALTA